MVLGGGTGCEGVGACALHAMCRNSTLLAMLNEGILGGMLNVACPSSYRLFRIIGCAVQHYKVHIKAHAQSSNMVEVSWMAMPDGPIYVKSSLLSLLYFFVSFMCH